jgi:hypothetical protein
MVDLKNIFKEFCEYLDGKIKWAGRNKTPKTEITAFVFNFFEEKLSQKEGLVKTSPYMLIDAVWRYPKPQSTDEGIQIALEHEISKRKISDFLKEEIQRLIDIKAKYKIGIFYPSSEVDEKGLKEGIEKKLKNSKYLAIPWEEYLFIFGKPSRKEGENIILFKAFHYSYDSSEYRNLKTTAFELIIIKQKEVK